jgi:glucose-1-phosphate thymidylyltransferase
LTGGTVLAIFTSIKEMEQDVMKGLLLAGGHGTRLYPCTAALSKQLLPVYDKPTIFYPLSCLMLAGIRDIMIISTPRDIPMIEELLQDGRQLGLNISYKTQAEPNGIAEVFLIAEDFIGTDPVCLILGDNIFYGADLQKLLNEGAKLKVGASVFAHHVQDPERYGVVEFDSNSRAVSVEEKPKQPKSNWAITGLYFYDNTVVERAKKLKPSKRGELEITEVNQSYLNDGTLTVLKMGRGFTWLDTGTSDSLLEASHFVQTIEKRQGLKLACLEEVAYSMRFINKEQLESIAKNAPKCDYSRYLFSIVERG